MKKKSSKSFNPVRFVEGLHAWLQREFAPLFKRIAQLEKKTLADDYKGVWRNGQFHERGSLATHAGGLWLCLIDTHDKPGTSKSWRLVAKGGKLT